MSTEDAGDVVGLDEAVNKPHREFPAMSIATLNLQRYSYMMGLWEGPAAWASVVFRSSAQGALGLGVAAQLGPERSAAQLRINHRPGPGGGEAGRSGDAGIGHAGGETLRSRFRESICRADQLNGHDDNASTC